MNLFQLTAEQSRIEDLLEQNGGEITPEIEEALTLTAEQLPRKVDGYGALLGSSPQRKPPPTRKSNASRA